MYREKRSLIREEKLCSLPFQFYSKSSKDNHQWENLHGCMNLVNNIEFIIVIYNLYQIINLIYINYPLNSKPSKLFSKTAISIIGWYWMIYFLTTYRINLFMLKDIMLKHNLEVNYFAFTQKYNCIIITSVICGCKGE